MIEIQQKGTILIIDNRIEEKIGVFQEYLQKDGYSIKTAQTLEEAEKNLNTLLGSNTLDGIILDFSFPVDLENQSVKTNNGIPNGVFLFKKYEFKIRNQRIPVVINTAGDEEYKKKYLGDIKKLDMPTYNVNHQANPLTQPTNIEMVKNILKMFNERTEQRKINSKIQPDKKWNVGGKSVICDPKTGNYMYRD